MTRYSLFTASIGSFSLAAVAHAHPGHGEPGDDFSVMHYATEPLHLGVGLCMLIGTVALIGVLRAAYSRRRQQKPVC
jgi:hypothetical protein